MTWIHVEKFTQVQKECLRTASTRLSLWRRPLMYADMGKFELDYVSLKGQTLRSDMGKSVEWILSDPWQFMSGEGISTLKYGIAPPVYAHDLRDETEKEQKSADELLLLNCEEFTSFEKQPRYYIRDFELNLKKEIDLTLSCQTKQARDVSSFLMGIRSGYLVKQFYHRLEENTNADTVDYLNLWQGPNPVDL